MKMNENRFAIKSQNDYWAVIDNYNGDKVCIINGIHTEIEAIWLCDLLNEQQATIIKQDKEIKRLEKMIWKIQWRFQQEVGIEKAKEHYQEIDNEMEEYYAGYMLECDN